MTRPRVVVENWVDDGVHWFGVRFGYPADSVGEVDAAEVVMGIKEALLHATSNN